MSRLSWSKSVTTIAAAVFAVSIMGRFAAAQVSSTGSVVLVDGRILPLTVVTPIPLARLPGDGNSIDPFAPTPPGQIFFEGIVDDNGTPANPIDDTNQNVSVVIGWRSFGAVQIVGEPGLRDQDLSIGDRGTVNGQMRNGTGVLRINGFGAVFNNDPAILPFDLETSPSPNPRPLDQGFDAYIGRFGTGTMEISIGGRAEIQDAVLIGDQPGSVGTLIVDGFDSFFGSGGMMASGGGMEEPHQMLIGHFGLGIMNITNGAQVVTLAPTLGGGQQDDVNMAAVIGGDPFDDTQPPEEGGEGLVTVGGPGTSGLTTVPGPTSKWILQGSLQVGGFHDANEGLLMGKDLDGDDVLYDSSAGRGTLRVLQGALVSILPQVDAEEDAELYFAIGRFGRVELNGGWINVGQTGLIDDGPRQPEIQVINDGVITGGGKISTGVFRNRYLGQIRIGPDEHLIVDASSEFTDTDLLLPDLAKEPLFNFGLIEVIGTVDHRAELEFLRSAGTPVPNNPIRPFINRKPFVTPPPGAFDGGIINAQHATLRFQSGIQNEATMAFTEGMNIISGRVDNITGSSNGLFLVFPNTTVVIEDDFASGGFTVPLPPALPIINVAAGGTIIVLDAGSFTMAGHLDMEISRSNPSRIEVGGDLGVNGNLFVSFAEDVFSTLAHGDAFELMYFAGDVGGVDFTDPARLIPNLATNPVLNVVTDPIFDLLFPNLDLIAVPVLQTYYLFALDPSMIGTGGAMGPDFNGDGVVDNIDLAIWQLNVGITMNASVLQGDADGDGDVDGDDFLIWQQNVGPFPGAGAGAGNDNLSANVPEPAGLALLFAGGLFGMTFRGSRRRCASRFAN